MREKEEQSKVQVNESALALLDWDKGQGLLPAIVQDARSLRVLMMGYMNAEALAQTRHSGYITFFSRQRQQLWLKGEQSGHRLRWTAIDADCDGDTLLLQANAQGPTCHLGRLSCFSQAPAHPLEQLDVSIAQRAEQTPVGSYTAHLFQQGVRRIAQKVGEEGVETALAAVAESPSALASESADLLYHLLVLLQARRVPLQDVYAVLQQRAQAGSAKPVAATLTTHPAGLSES